MFCAGSIITAVLLQRVGVETGAALLLSFLEVVSFLFMGEVMKRATAMKISQQTSLSAVSKGFGVCVCDKLDCSSFNVHF